MNKPKGFAIIKAAVGNYRTWILAMTYGYSFGVELTVDNVISQCAPRLGGSTCPASACLHGVAWSHARKFFFCLMSTIQAHFCQRTLAVNAVCASSSALRALFRHISVNTRWL
jgi:nitrate/nitrite transporter NarK